MGFPNRVFGENEVDMLGSGEIIRLNLPFLFKIKNSIRGVAGHLPQG